MIQNNIRPLMRKRRKIFFTTTGFPGEDGEDARDERSMIDR